MGPGPSRCALAAQRRPAVGRGAEIYLMLLLPSRGPGMDSGDKHLALISPGVLRVNGGPGNILVMLEKSLGLILDPAFRVTRCCPRTATESACSAAAAPRGTQSRDTTEPLGQAGQCSGLLTQMWTSVSVRARGEHVHTSLLLGPRSKDQRNRLRPAPLTTDVCHVYLLSVNSSVSLYTRAILRQQMGCWTCREDPGGEETILSGARGLLDFPGAP